MSQSNGAVKVASGSVTFQFEPGEGGAERVVKLGVVSALRSVWKDELKLRPDQLDALKQYVKDVGKLEISDDEADNLLDELLRLDREKKARTQPATSPSSTTSTPSA